jgi:hypothetical protein
MQELPDTRVYEQEACAPESWPESDMIQKRSKDRWGISWQITPRALTDALAAGGGEAKRAFEAMMTMKKIDVAAIETARRG